MMTYQQRFEPVDIDALLQNHREGYSLDRPFYVDPAIFELEFEHIISRQWQYADHINRIPHKGDYVLFRIAGEEIIIIRGEGETVYAHFNVCRHRGSRICLENEGHTTRLVCPYHAWAYRLDGSLANARAMRADFDPADFGLRSCQVRVLAGLIFINLTADADAVPDFNPIARDLAPWIKNADLWRTKIAFHEIYPSHVNWKIALENYFECYHCVTAHPELCRVQLHHTHRDGIGTAAALAKYDEHHGEWTRSAKAFGYKTGSVYSPIAATARDNYMTQAYYAERMLTHYDPDDAYSKLKKDDLMRPTKLMGHYIIDDRGMVDWGLLPNCFVNTHCTSTVIYRITPLSATECELSQTWLVHEDAVEGVDYEVEGVIWLDRVTQLQDEAIVRNTQAGISSRYYEPGPYAELEDPILQVHQDYIRMLRHGRGLPDLT